MNQLSRQRVSEHLLYLISLPPSHFPSMHPLIKPNWKPENKGALLIDCTHNLHLPQSTVEKKKVESISGRVNGRCTTQTLLPIKDIICHYGEIHMYLLLKILN